MRSLPAVGLVCFAGALAGCVSVDYLGRQYAPTTSVDVFYAMDEVKREHEVMGQSEARAGEGTKLLKIQEELVKDARTRGADAIVIVDVGSIVTGESTTTDGFASERDRDKGGWRGTYSESSRTTLDRDTIVRAKLLKYR